MRKVVRQIDRGRTGDVRQGQVEEEKVEGVALDLGDRPNEIRLSDDFEGTTARAGENSADFICNVDVIFDEKDADEFFIGTDVFAMRKAIRRQREWEGTLANRAADALGAIKMVQSFRREELEIGRFGAQNKGSLKTGVKAARFEAKIRWGSELSVAVVTAAAWAFRKAPKALRFTTGSFVLAGVGLHLTGLGVALDDDALDRFATGPWVESHG